MAKLKQTQKRKNELMDIINTIDDKNYYTYKIINGELVSVKIDSKNKIDSKKERYEHFINTNKKRKINIFNILNPFIQIEKLINSKSHKTF
jgi:hypothetical protein